MSAADLLAELEAAGVVFEPRGDRLHVEAPRGVLTAERKRLLGEYKPSVLAVLSRGDALLRRAVADTSWTVDDLWRALSHADRADVDAGEVDADRLRAFIGVVEERHAREAGVVPAHYTERAWCERCGSVWLWTADTVQGCTWCSNRLNGRPIPRPHERTDGIEE